MGLKQCPICELNYIREDEIYCNVCRRNIKSGAKDTDEQSLCTECGEAPPLSGKELCADCLSEKRRREKLEKLMDNPSLAQIDVDALNEIDVDLPSGISSDELNNSDKDYDEDEDEELDDDDDEYGQSPDEP